MSAFRGRGSYWGPRPAGPSTSAASGWWSAAGQFLYERDGTWPSAVETDPNFSSVSLLLHMNGSNGSTTFTDSSSNAIAISRIGDAQISTAQSKFGGASAYFDGIGDMLTATQSSGYAFGTGEFCIEGWVYFSSLPLAGSQVVPFSCGSGGATVAFWQGSMRFAIANVANVVDYASAAIVASSWFHWAITRSSGTVRLFVNGALLGSTTYSSSLNPSDAATIGAHPGGILPITGYIDELRVTKGVARYTAAFTAPTAPFPDA